MNEKLIQETMQLIRLSGHVIEGQLMFEPWSDRAMQFIDGLAPQGYSLHAKLPEPLEQELIDWAHKDRHIWALARGYALRMEAERLLVGPAADEFSLLLTGGFEKKWPRGKKESFYRDDLLCILIQYLITVHNMKTRAVFGKEQSAPVIVFEAFQRLGFKDRLRAKDYAKRWEINRKRSSYATDYFKRKA
ncbi:MAG: hypothetical protein ACPG6H_12625, partial [Paracoccaceae bacterium]